MSLLEKLLDLNMLEKEHYPALRSDARFMRRVRELINYYVKWEELRREDEETIAKAIKTILVRDVFFGKSGITWRSYVDRNFIIGGKTFEECKEIMERLEATNINDLHVEREKYKTLGLIDKMYTRYKYE